MTSPSPSQGDGNDRWEPTQNGSDPKRNAAAQALVKEFQAVLEREDQALREQFGEGFNPMEAQARALLWLVALQGIHISAVKQAIAESNGEAVSGWAEDLGKLSAAIAILETIQPIS
ncbi:MAG: hypothetical protein TE42_01320 [Candidatus Synechococcus spongiarum SP3]|uniref:Uncharacterized protein n=1 Tax=Candidatus Synechococcus spongiarum SP3 TaxID=1604020 RepID=A0A0G2HNK1_9SYNE|nr:MAG: hypothetical protein TE42_01320 [Candidatus Synechococcus spongiarum SP3]